MSLSPSKMLTQRHVILLLGAPCTLAVACGLVPGPRSGTTGETRGSTSRLLSCLQSTCGEPREGVHGCRRRGAQLVGAWVSVGQHGAEVPLPLSPLPPACTGRDSREKENLVIGYCTVGAVCVFQKLPVCSNCQDDGVLRTIQRSRRRGVLGPAHLCWEVPGNSKGLPGGSPSSKHVLLVLPTEQALE